MCRHKDILTQIGWYSDTCFLALNLTQEQLTVLADLRLAEDGEMEELIAKACREYLDNRTCKANRDVRSPAMSRRSAFPVTPAT